MMGMRLAGGVPNARFKERFGVPLADAFGEAIRGHVGGGARRL